MSRPERVEPPPDQEPPDDPAGRPNAGRLFDLLTRPLAVRSLAVTGLLLIAVFYTLYFAREIFVPVVAALVLQLILVPVQRGLVRLRLPEPVGAAVIVLGLVGGVAYGASYLSGPVASWFDRMPEVAYDVQRKLAALKAPVEEVVSASKQVQALADVDGEAPQVVVKGASLLQQAFGGLRYVVTQLVVVFILLYFLLASGDLFKLKLVKVLPRLQDKKRAVAIVRQIEHDVSTYLFTVTLINIALGCAIGAGLWAIGLPNAALWGVLSVFLNYIPFLGPLAGIIIVAAVAVVSLDTMSHALLAPGLYLGLAVLEGNFVTPALLGRRLLINPVFLVVNIVFWGWLWGVPGALLAGPLLLALKVLCDHIEPLAAVGEFLGGRDA